MNKMKKVVHISIWVIVLIGLFALLGFINKEQKAVKCKGLEIYIDDAVGNFFVDDDDIREIISNLGYRVYEQSVCEIDIGQIEHVLNNNPSIANANVYATIDGRIKIKITQRNPIIRIYNQNGESYYIDKNGWLMPLSEKFTSRVLVANGNINEPYSLRYHTNIGSLKSLEDTLSTNNILKQLYILASFVHKDSFWKAQIMQVFMNNEGDMELIPRVGNHTIILGDVSGLKDKFSKLMIFYKQGLSKTGWNEYSTINLKYNNQVICTKK